MRPMIQRLTRALKIGAVIGTALGLARALRGKRSPEVTGHASWPPLVEPTEPEPRSGPVRFDDVAPADDSGNEETGNDDSGNWLAPTGSTCPVDHPIKAKAGSGIYHVPGGSSYDRTTPERCYPTTDAAEADGFRAAKR